MDAKWIITAFVLIDTLLEQFNHRSHKLAQVSDSETLTVAVVAAKYFQNHHERALCVLREAHYLSGRLNLTRFNRGLHAFADWVAFIACMVGKVFRRGGVFVIDDLLPTIKLSEIAGSAPEGTYTVLVEFAASIATAWCPTPRTTRPKGAATMISRPSVFGQVPLSACCTSSSTSWPTH
jgi:hypothetical protein